MERRSNENQIVYLLEKNQMKTKLFKIKIPDRLYDHITAKLVQNLLNVNYLEREKFVVEDITDKKPRR